MMIRKFIWIFVGILVMMAWLLGFIIEAQAETMKCKVVRLVTKEETMPVSDEEVIAEQGDVHAERAKKKWHR